MVPVEIGLGDVEDMEVELTVADGFQAEPAKMEVQSEGDRPLSDPRPTSVSESPSWRSSP